MSDLDPVTEHLMEAVGAYDERTLDIMELLQQLTAQTADLAEAVKGIQQRVDRIERRTHRLLTADQLYELADQLGDDAAYRHDQLNTRPEYSTKEQWQAWECINTAASHIASAAVYLERSEQP